MPPDPFRKPTPKGQDVGWWPDHPRPFGLSCTRGVRGNTAPPKGRADHPRPCGLSCTHGVRGNTVPPRRIDPLPLTQSNIDTYRRERRREAPHKTTTVHPIRSHAGPGTAFSILSECPDDVTDFLFTIIIRGDYCRVVISQLDHSPLYTGPGRAFSILSVCPDQVTVRHSNTTKHGQIVTTSGNSLRYQSHKNNKSSIQAWRFKFITIPHSPFSETE